MTQCDINGRKSLGRRSKKGSSSCLKVLPLGMPKPDMKPEDVEALDKALQEMHAAEIDVQKAFLERRPWEGDKAIKKARQARFAWISLGAKFFTNWPV